MSSVRRCARGIVAPEARRAACAKSAPASPISAAAGARCCPAPPDRHWTEMIARSSSTPTSCAWKVSRVPTARWGWGTGWGNVGLAPELAAERQRDAEWIARVEHALAAPKAAQHRRLQHLGQQRDLGRCILRAAADQRSSAASRHKALGGISATRPRRSTGCRTGRGFCAVASPLRPHTLIPHSKSARGGPAGHHGANASATRRGGPCPGRARACMADHALENAELVIDFVQMAQSAADILVGNLADQRQHRRIHRIRGEQRGAGIEQGRGRAPPRSPAACRSPRQPPSAI